MSILEDYKQARRHKEEEKKRARVIQIWFIIVKFFVVSWFLFFKVQKYIYNNKETQLRFSFLCTRGRFGRFSPMGIVNYVKWFSSHA